MIISKFDVPCQWLCDCDCDSVTLSLLIYRDDIPSGYVAKINIRDRDRDRAAMPLPNSATAAANLGRPHALSATVWTFLGSLVGGLRHAVKAVASKILSLQGLRLACAASRSAALLPRILTISQ
jgi:hypothetical protein